MADTMLWACEACNNVIEVDESTDEPNQKCPGCQVSNRYREVEG